MFRTTQLGNLFWGRMFKKSPYPNIPHLQGDLFTGRLSHLTLNTLDEIEKAGKLAEKNPSGAITFWVENKLILFLTKPEDVYKFKMHCQQYMHIQPSTWDIFPGTAALTDDEYHPKVRSQYAQCIAAPNALHKLAPTIDNICAQHIHDLKINPSIDNTGRYFRKWASTLAAKLLMGIDTIDHDALLDFIDECLLGPNPRP